MLTGGRVQFLNKWGGMRSQPVRRIYFRRWLSARMETEFSITGAVGIVLRVLFFSLVVLALMYPACARAQDNYEIQVYPSETMAPKTLLVELHSNFTVDGSPTTQFGMLPTEHQEHETIELTEGINDWFEVGF